MPRLTKTLAMMLVACGVSTPAIVSAADGAPVGAWRTTNDCFLAAFFLSEGDRAQAVYISGEKDDDAAWAWDGRVLTITSPAFPKDSFSARLMNDQVQADYVWHDTDKDELNKQACIFEHTKMFRLF